MSSPTSPPESLTSWAETAASSRRSLPTASMSAETASGPIRPPARRTSERTNSTRSSDRVSLAQPISNALALRAASSSAFPFAPPACWSTTTVPSAGTVRKGPSAATAAARMS